MAIFLSDRLVRFLRSVKVNVTFTTVLPPPPPAPAYTEEEGQAFKDEIGSLKANLAQLERLMVGRVRQGTIVLDEVELTRRLRAIEPSLRAETDRYKIVVYGTAHFDETVLNAIENVFKPVMDRT